MRKRLQIYLTSEEWKNLEKESNTAGFYRISEYCRFLLFNQPLTKKIDVIYKKVVG